MLGSDLDPPLYIGVIFAVFNKIRMTPSFKDA